MLQSLIILAVQNSTRRKWERKTKYKMKCFHFEQIKSSKPCSSLASHTIENRGREEDSVSHYSNQGINFSFIQSNFFHGLFFAK